MLFKSLKIIVATTFILNFPIVVNAKDKMSPMQVVQELENLMASNKVEEAVMLINTNQKEKQSMIERFNKYHDDDDKNHFTAIREKILDNDRVAGVLTTSFTEGVHRFFCMKKINDEWKIDNQSKDILDTCNKLEEEMKSDKTLPQEKKDLMKIQKETKLLPAIYIKAIKKEKVKDGCIITLSVHNNTEHKLDFGDFGFTMDDIPNSFLNSNMLPGQVLENETLLAYGVPNCPESLSIWNIRGEDKYNIVFVSTSVAKITSGYSSIKIIDESKM